MFAEIQNALSTVSYFIEVGRVVAELLKNGCYS